MGRNTNSAIPPLQLMMKTTMSIPISFHFQGTFTSTIPPFSQSGPGKRSSVIIAGAHLGPRWGTGLVSEEGGFRAQVS